MSAGTSTTAYVANTVVRTRLEKWKRCAYTAYSGVARFAPAMRTSHVIQTVSGSRIHCGYPI